MFCSVTCRPTCPRSSASGRPQSFLATTIALLAYIGFIFLAGYTSDRVERRRMLMLASALFIVLSVPAFMLLDTQPLIARAARSDERSLTLRLASFGSNPHIRDSAGLR